MEAWLQITWRHNIKKSIQTYSIYISLYLAQFLIYNASYINRDFLIRRYITDKSQTSRAQFDLVNSCFMQLSSKLCGLSEVRSMSSHVSESPQYQMPQKRGIKTQKKRAWKRKEHRRVMGKLRHRTRRHTSTCAFLINEGHAGVFVSHRESCQSVVLWRQFEDAWVDGSALTKIRNISYYLATPQSPLALFGESVPT